MFYSPVRHIGILFLIPCILLPRQNLSPTLPTMQLGRHQFGLDIRVRYASSM